MNKHPHKSTTTPERFFHKRNVFEEIQGRMVAHLTVFMRQDKDGKWYASRAECDVRDQFCRHAGRVIARRKWFQGKKREVPEPTYEHAY